MRSTPPRRAVAIGALVAAGAMLTVGVQTTSATAGTDTAGSAPRQAIHKADPGALPARLSPAQRTALVRHADAAEAETARTLGLGPKEKLVVKDVVKDNNGAVHTRYERTYDGLPVLGGDLVVDSTSAGKVTTVAKATKQRLALATTTPSLAPAAAGKQAVAAARAHGSKASKPEKAPRKVVWAADGKPVLAYETVVGGIQHDGTPSRLHVITDAASGKKLFAFQDVKTGTGNTQHSGQVTIGTTKVGNTYQLWDQTRGGHKTYNLNHATSGTGSIITSPNDVFGNGTTSDPATAGADAHYGAQLTWDYYKNVHGRSGIRGDGVGAYSRVHYGNNYVNAFWDDSCFCMTYGDGNGIPLTSIDVAAHEMTHGVTSATANLTYSGESGGLNEATSDMFATAVEFWAGNPKDPGDYLIGEKIDINGDGTPLRYMDKPSKDRRSKDAWYSGLGGIDVHYSSGPANHWFYLASEGSGAKDINGVHYDSPTSDGLPVTGIGRDNAAKIWFKALTERMRSNTNYAGARDATLWAAGELFGVGSDTYNNVANAWAAINVGSRATTGVSVTSPGDQTSVVNQAVSLQLKASGTTGSLTWSATGLPAGLTLNSSTGLISGTPTATGTSDVTVTVKDGAGRTGSASFKWTVNTTGGGSVFENGTPVDIPDAGAAVTSPIVVTRSGSGSPALKVDVNISHTYRGDLTIDLVAPDGKTWRLKDSDTWDSAADVNETYTVDASGVTASGTWKLKVQDVYAGDSGRIDKWRLTF
ncbi:M4 family metallopeptidase [Streptomyces caatingaensis]|uniref:Peptidase M4 n=1 Tax=Streptomyces caatingaensis TaxID=1678637 RepID=A0A0K9XC72_9ACTN|nr:M4 family metallopeptidase [Streptomyces caatingaensis]KNB51020.1 peptidase M4 [Streptomyces caatingaensis]